MNPNDPSLPGENIVVEEITEVIIEPKRRFNIPPALRLPIVWTGLLSAALILGLSYVITYAGQALVYSTYAIPAVGLTVTVAYFLAFLLASVGPAIILGSKQGVAAGIKVLIAELLWFVILFSIMYYSFPTPPSNQMYPGF